MTFKFITEVTFDFDKEINRINDLFEGEIKERQLEILRLFKEGDFSGALARFDDLPYDEDEECWEKEYVGSWFWDINDGLKGCDKWEIVK